MKYLMPPDLDVLISAKKIIILTHDCYREYSPLKSDHYEADTHLVLHAADALHRRDLAVIIFVLTLMRW